MSHERTSPVASRVIAKCGGHKAVAKLTGVDLSNVYRWTYSKSRGGTGGVIPAEPLAILVDAARTGLVDLEATDIVDLPPKQVRASAQAGAA